MKANSNQSSSFDGTEFIFQTDSNEQVSNELSCPLNFLQSRYQEDVRGSIKNRSVCERAMSMHGV